MAKVDASIATLFHFGWLVLGFGKKQSIRVPCKVISADICHHMKKLDDIIRTEFDVKVS